jgi:hypothetical protein
MMLIGLTLILVARSRNEIDSGSSIVRGSAGRAGGRAAGAAAGRGPSRRDASFRFPPERLPWEGFRAVVLVSTAILHLLATTTQASGEACVAHSLLVGATMIGARRLRRSQFNRTG